MHPSQVLSKREQLPSSFSFGLKTFSKGWFRPFLSLVVVQKVHYTSLFLLRARYFLSSKINFFASRIFGSDSRLVVWDPEPTAATEGWPKQLGSPPGGIQAGTTRISTIGWQSGPRNDRINGHWRTSTMIPFRGRLNIPFSSSGDQTFFSFGRVVLQLWKTQQFSGKSRDIWVSTNTFKACQSVFILQVSHLTFKKVNGEREQPFQNQLFVCWASLPSCTLFNWCNLENPRIWHEISTKLCCCFGMHLRKYPARNKNNNSFVVDSSA